MKLSSIQKLRNENVKKTLAKAKYIP